MHSAPMLAKNVPRNICQSICVSLLKDSFRAVWVGIAWLPKSPSQVVEQFRDRIHIDRNTFWGGHHLSFTILSINANINQIVTFVNARCNPNGLSRVLWEFPKRHHSSPSSSCENAS